MTLREKSIKRHKLLQKISELFLMISLRRSDPAGILVSFRECESSMFRASKLLQPNIPKSAQEFCVQLPTTNFAANLMGHFTLFLNNFTNCGPFLVHLADILFLCYTVYLLIKTRNCIQLF